MLSKGLRETLIYKTISVFYIDDLKLNFDLFIDEIKTSSMIIFNKLHEIHDL